MAIQNKSLNIAAAMAGDRSRCRQELGPLAADIHRVIAEIDENARAPQ